jgi:hypothetical protein
MPSDRPRFFDDSSDEVAANTSLRRLLDQVLSHPEIHAPGAQKLWSAVNRSSDGFVLEIDGYPLKDIMHHAKRFLDDDDLAGAWKFIEPFAGREIRFGSIVVREAAAGLPGDSVELDDELAGDSVEQDDDGPPRQRAY